MVIEEISVRDFGTLGVYEASLHPTLNVLRTRETGVLGAAIPLLLCSKAGSPFPSHWVRPGTRLEARVLLGDVRYRVCAAAGKNGLVLTVTDPAGVDVTEAYRDTLTHCAEQDAVEHFDGQDKRTPHRLCRYRSCRDWEADQNLPHRTDRITDTKTFRSHLVRYIKEFQPEPIHSSKPYLTGITPQGQFTVFHPAYSGRVFLSETEEKLFHYICFLNTAEFWEAVEKNRDLHHERKPLLLHNFLEYLDASTQLDKLIARTLRLQRQVLILTHETALPTATVFHCNFNDCIIP